MHKKHCILLLIVSLPFWFACSSRQDRRESAIPSDQETISQGQTLFQNNCSACHNFRQKGIGPNLSDVTAEVKTDWLRQFIHNAPDMIEKGDDRATRLYQEYNQYMPAFTTLKDTEIDAIIAYLHAHPQNSVPALEEKKLGNILTDPLPEKIQASGIQLVLEEVATLPASAEKPPLARINKMLTLPAQKDRTFIHDLRGKLYETKGKNTTVFLNVPAYFPDFIDQPGLGTGLGSFAFHPDYEKNGLLYTTHTEKARAAPADFTYADSIPVTLQWVLTEWKTDRPTATTFAGTHRELLRINMVSGIHGVQEITFNPLAAGGDADHGLLYIGIGDGGATLEGYPFVAHDKSKPWGTILRINPTGNNSRNGKYGIPSDNPFASDADALREIWAYGFRNPHRIGWDKTGTKKMLATDIGQKAAEEINLIIPGADYGWNLREGTFRINPEGDVNEAYALPDNDQGFTYPVAQYDHDEGNAISGGFVYAGKDIPALQGKYIFGDIVTGRIFYVASDQLKLGQQVPVYEVGVQVAGRETTLRQLTDNKRVDLRFGEGPGNELYILTKADGKVWKVVDVRQQERVSALPASS